MSDTKRPAFAMIMAIMVVLLVASGGALLMSRASMGNASINSSYLHAQAELLAESATEFAVMRAQGDTMPGGRCLNRLSITVNDAQNTPMFDITVSLSYSFNANAVNDCTLIQQNTNTGENLVLVDTTVTDHNLSSEDIRIHKRSWQKL